MNLKVATQRTCCQCGMEKSNWSAPHGVKKEGDLFCCQRCADNTGCRCEESLRQERLVGRSISPRAMCADTRKPRRLARPAPSVAA